ncbi:hypothetical protein [Roseibium aggregatum]|uniref:von Hippel-Lindau disease tumour suppressor beta domain-containing protein n=1 Tax=Roseibium aggregatum TaxID=187304 RepID=A0A939EIW9_9HYPH|nr:hypothetical protein [Roseibium aggregatum]MBN9673118.1 hypothetical protein [Roseibium aggregatum]
MRLAAAYARCAPKMKTGWLTVCSALLLMSGETALGQSVPETVRINVEPKEPGIRSITVNKKYRPIISRDENGVVIDTLGSGSAPPPCDVKLEVTLENSRVLHRDANLCGGGTLVVDVSNDGKPGAAARIVGTGSGVAAGPVTSAPATSSPPSSSTSTPPAGAQTAAAPANSDTPATAGDSSPSGSGGLRPLEEVETPISTPGSAGTDTAALPGNFETMVRDRLSSGDGNPEPRLISANENRQWLAEPGSQPGSASFLQHAVPQTDDRDFRADCNTQSGLARVTFQQAPAGLVEGMPQTVQITAGDFSNSYGAFGSSSQGGAGVSLPEVSLEMTDPLWEALIRQSELSVTVEGMPAYQVSLKGSANPVRLFVATCALPQQIVSDEAYGEEPGSDRSCSELGRIRSLEANRPGTIVFRNTSRQPIEVNWIDYRGGERPYARLEPGQILEQQTYVSHAWSVRGAGGECRGIYVTRTPFREVVFKGPANFGTGAPAGGFNAPLGQDGLQNGQFNNGGFPNGPVPPGNVGAGNQPLFPQQQQTARTNVADYLCTAGIDLNVVFSPDGQTATVSEMGYGAVTLQRRGSANSFHYEEQGHVLRGQVQNATWSRPGLRDVFCARR